MVDWNRILPFSKEVVENSEEKKDENTQELAYVPTPADSFAEGVPIAAKFTPKRIRVPSDELELTYIHDPAVFGGVNRIVQNILSTDRNIVGNKEKYVDFIKGFMSKIGNSGNDMTETEFLYRSFWSQLIFGLAWVQLIKNKKETLIVDLDIIDSKTMDYAKDGSNSIVFDVYGRPIGYVQSFTYLESVPEHLKKFTVFPEGVGTLQANEIFIPRDRIALLKLFTVGDEFYPLGVVEPLYQRSIRKLNMEEALANSVYTMGFPIKYASVGDERHKPNPAEVGNVLDKLKKLDFKTSIALPYWQKLQLLQATRVEDLKEQLSYFTESQAAAMGVPLAYIMGNGNGVDKNTAVFLDNLFTDTLTDIVKRTVEDIQKRIFKQILELEFSKEKIPLKDVPIYQFGHLGTGVLEKQADRLRKLKKAEVLPEEDEEVEKGTLEREKLPEEPEKIKDKVAEKEKLR